MKFANSLPHLNAAQNLHSGEYERAVYLSSSFFVCLFVCLFAFFLNSLLFQACGKVIF